MLSLHPGLILIVTGLLVLFLPKTARNIVSLGGAVLAFAAVLMLSPESSMTFGFVQGITMDLLHVDMLAKAFGLIFGIIAVIAGIYAFDGCGKLEKASSLIYAGSSLGVVFAGD